MKTPLTSADELTAFAESVRNHSDFECEPVVLSEMAEWRMHEGMLSHASGGFFHVAGIVPTSGGEGRLMLYQPQSAFNGLLICQRGQEVYVLVQARIEPGNSGVVQYGPTVQSTPANYLRMHGGKTTPHMGLFHGADPRAMPLGNLLQTDLGNRYFQKNKTLSYIQVREWIHAEAPWTWVALDALAASASRHFLLNTDLKSMLAVFDWERFLGHAEVESCDAGAELPATGPFTACMSCENRFHFQALEKLENWRVDETGIHPLGTNGYGCSYYRCLASTRENLRWNQPLLYAHTRGLIRLFFRSAGGRTDFLLSKGSQPGLTVRQSYFPTFLRSPGEPIPTEEDLPAGARLVVDVLQSDEGGRFISHESRCQLVEVADTHAAADNQVWMDSRLVKQMLASPLSCSIELRGMLALALNLLNPRSIRSSGTSWHT